MTACTKSRQPKLIACAPRILDVLAGVHSGHDAELHAATVMPDHMHILLTLGTRLRLGQLIAKLKTLSRDYESGHWEWQDDFFEHRLRVDESLEDYARYIFMNPYRKDLLRLEERWPWWFCPDPSRFTFSSLIAQGNSVPAEWIGQSQMQGRKLRQQAGQIPPMA